MLYIKDLIELSTREEVREIDIDVTTYKELSISIANGRFTELKSTEKFLSPDEVLKIINKKRKYDSIYDLPFMMALVRIDCGEITYENGVLKHISTSERYNWEKYQVWLNDNGTLGKYSFSEGTTFPPMCVLSGFGYIGDLSEEERFQRSTIHGHDDTIQVLQDIILTYPTGNDPNFK
ncbi:hypothetical protein [Klebsiella michiganensis]|nr:hypothetical protein [Klebsiella michiganensis]TYD91081.1 hypothetical protein DJ519_01550 [Klebsiella michiganensis]